MKSIIVTWETIHLFGDAWFQHHQLRKRVFVDKMGWQVPHTSTAEWDQYDTAYSTYSIVLDDYGKCIAAARMNPTTATNGIFSYMIKDATTGVLPHLDFKLLNGPPPVSPKVWEGTRFVIDPDLDRRTSQAAQSMVIDGMMTYAKENEIRCFLGLMPLGVYSLLRRLGFKIVEIGLPANIDNHTTKVAVLPVL